MRVVREILLVLLAAVIAVIAYVTAFAWKMGMFQPHYDTFAFHSCETDLHHKSLRLNVNVEDETAGRRYIMFSDSDAVMRTGGVATAFGFTQLKSIEVSGSDMRLVFPSKDGKANVKTITNVSESCRAELKTLLARTFPVNY